MEPTRRPSKTSKIAGEMIGIVIATGIAAVIVSIAIRLIAWILDI